MSLLDAIDTTPPGNPVHHDGHHWRPVPNWTHYWISDHGTLYNTRTMREIQGSINHHGKLGVNLTDHGRTRSCELYRLVAETFIPGAGIVRHRNGNILDNRASNLRWEHNPTLATDGLRCPNCDAIRRTSETLRVHRALAHQATL